MTRSAARLSVQEASCPTDTPANLRAERVERARSQTSRIAAACPRATTSRALMARHRLEPFHNALCGLAVAVFGEEATVVPHMRTVEAAAG